MKKELSEFLIEKFPIKRIEAKINRTLSISEEARCTNLVSGKYYSAHAVYHLFNKENLEKAKQFFFLYGRAIEINVRIFDSDQSLQFYIQDAVYLLLSDNIDLIERFSEIKGENYSSRLKGGSLVPLIQALIRGDFELFDKQLKVSRNRAEKKDWKWMTPDLDALEGIRTQDIPKIEEAIMTLATKKHRYRNSGKTYSKLLSIPALGYAKLAWLKGIEVEIDHPLIPKELLPVKPNSEYWEYDYMKMEDFK
ncbi:Imm49 family immunity protein [Pseudoalteromonas sp. Of7M-16]|uniref:Imm49 family immunity protein n=1 Tax=Pseudoalteromonas sp. Of7M-16 TaxID=2917756 RepID=UPI001EF4BC68|nr:Imm49 family immunity protein [Pseudoalteromonas sp. Of7M-16]MCG7549045.1 immunity 49 family protein [Pseudoalteromonas sp. Of7M-16]